ncbi:MAG TPA: glycosyltransferase family 2 protein [Terracidiphilus sp.]|nr:glycosyltransferase family 2 protein [Terracidiphilus sp.]
MTVTVILCTYNRCDTLTRTLESLAASSSPQSFECEVLVVDNNSSDRTRQVVEGFCRRSAGNFRYIFERQQGKSFALNAGIRAARGDVLAFLDDDVTVASDWLERLTAPLEESREWAGTGGRIVLDGSFSAPAWLPVGSPFGALPALAALFDLGDKPQELHQAPYGTNMAFRKIMFEKYGLFRTDLGPSPNRGTPRPNEDTEFGRRLLAAGERLHYEPSAVVYHPVPESRVRRYYLLDWWFDYGRSLIRERGKGSPIWGFPRHYFGILKMIGRVLPSYTLRWIRTVNTRERFRWKCAVWCTAGQICETFRVVSETDQMRSEYIPSLSEGRADR